MKVGGASRFLTQKQVLTILHFNFKLLGKIEFVSIAKIRLSFQLNFFSLIRKDELILYSTDINDMDNDGDIIGSTGDTISFTCMSANGVPVPYR